MSGEPHLVLLLDEFGAQSRNRPALRRTSCVWEENGRTVRLEGDLTLEEALDMADSAATDASGARG